MSKNTQSPVIVAGAVTIEIKDGMISTRDYIISHRDKHGMEILQDPTYPMFKDNLFLNLFDKREDNSKASIAHYIVNIAGKKIRSIFNSIETGKPESQGLPDKWRMVQINHVGDTCQPIGILNKYAPEGSRLEDGFKILNKQYRKEKGERYTYISIVVLINTAIVGKLIINTAGMTYHITNELTRIVSIPNIQGVKIKLTIDNKPLLSFVKPYEKGGFIYHAVDINGQHLIIDGFKPDLLTSKFSIIEKGTIFKIRQLSEAAYVENMFNLHVKDTTTIGSIKKKLSQEILGLEYANEIEIRNV